MRPLKLDILAATCALTLLGPAAWCSPAEERYDFVGKVRVRLNDLNLDDPADAQTLLTRLNDAAYVACGGNPKRNNSYQARPEKTIQVYAECRENAVKRAVEKINARTLARAYAEEAQDRAASVPRVIRCPREPRCCP